MKAVVFTGEYGRDMDMNIHGDYTHIALVVTEDNKRKWFLKGKGAEKEIPYHRIAYVLETFFIQRTKEHRT